MFIFNKGFKSDIVPMSSMTIMKTPFFEKERSNENPFTQKTLLVKIFNLNKFIGKFFKALNPTNTVWFKT